MGKLRPVIRKVDVNHPEIVAAFRKLGYTVHSTVNMGKGFPDIICGKNINGRELNFMIEIKDGSRPPSARRLTSDEQDFASTWRGQYAVIESVEQVIAFNKAQGELA